MYKKFLNVQWFPNFNKGQTQNTPAVAEISQWNVVVLFNIK